ncbi:tripartite tricarboxylate transporter permease [Desulfosporosinus sp. FKA]|uniref:tripartite tricarboxylate transporter permease n=1 Tax=Desulfosporosinus sp. FKA TaxID=1969834 RepID=UPI000B499B38|nr:tripartite tricarboxylate transporter permease [Desulfosporosinus sp. FKA]
MEAIMGSLHLLIDPNVLLFMVLGVLAGLLIGVMPGLTGPMALALAIPLTFYMGALQSILFLTSIHMGALYAGSITAITVNTPGKASAAATALDGYPLTVNGQSRKAIQMSAVAALIGSTLSAISLMFFAPLLGKVALAFGPSEYFALGLFGLSVVAAVAGKSLPKAVAVAALGIFISTIGSDPLMGTDRFIFGINDLSSGISQVPALTGLFAVSEIFNQLYKKKHVKKEARNVEGEGLTLVEVKKSSKTLIKSGIIGVIVGALPGTGSVIASFLGYNEAVRSSKTPEKFGKGELEGVAAAECAAVGTESAALIPLLTFGVPGDISAAILLGAFTLHGVRVGPEIFTTFRDVTYGLFIGIFLIQMLVFVFGWYGSVWLAKIVRIPKHFLFAVISVLVVCGSFALNNNMFDVWITLIFGLIGFILQRRDYPISPLLLGLILGPIIEQNFCLAMTSTGANPILFLIRPITLAILVLAAITIVFSYKTHRKMQKRTASNAA